MQITSLRHDYQRNAQTPVYYSICPYIICLPGDGQWRNRWSVGWGVDTSVTFSATPLTPERGLGRCDPFRRIPLSCIPAFPLAYPQPSRTDTAEEVIYTLLAHQPADQNQNSSFDVYVRYVQ